jgi:hypothetical protein
VSEREGYVANRVLLSVQDVIDNEWRGVGCYLTGAQASIVVNLLAYAHRRNTFVDTYYTDYYTTPDDDDWDEIQSIVADLEDKLMPSNNVLLGIEEAWAENFIHTKDGAGTFSGETGVVPSGYIYHLQSATLTNHTGDRGGAFITVYDGSANHYKAYAPSSTRYLPLTFTGDIALGPGSKVTFAMQSCLDSDSIRYGVLGYKQAMT